MSTPGRLRAGWMLLAGTGAAATISLALLVLASVFVTVASARASQSVPTRALRTGLARVSPVQRAVIATVPLVSAGGQTGPVVAGPIAGDSAQLRSNMAGARLPLASAGADWSSLTTAYATVTRGGHAAFDGSVPPQLEIVYRDPLSRHARLVTGRLPRRGYQGPRGPVFQVAVTAATARRFGLRAGSRLRLEPDLTLLVTGIVRPLQPDSAFWNTDPVAAAPAHNLPTLLGNPYWQGAAFVGPAELARLQNSTDDSATELSWGFPLALGRLTAAQAGVVQSRLSPASLSALGAVSLDPPVEATISCGVAAFLDNFSSERAGIGAVLSLLLASLVAVAAIAVLLGSFMLAQQRRGEFDVLRARGASRWQLAVLALRAAALAAIPAALAGAAAAVAVTPGAATTLAWWLGGLTLAVALAGLPLLTVAGQRSGARARPRDRDRDRRTVRRRAAVRRLVIEAALVALAAGGLIVARRQGVPGAGQDLLTSTTPVLAAIPAAIVAMRCYPLLARWLLRAAGLRRGVVAYVGLARAARSTLAAMLPAFALILVLAVIAFGTMVRGAITRGEVAASWQQTGADAAVNTLDSSLPLTPAARRAIAAVPGVARTAAVTMTSGAQANGTRVAIAVVSPGEYAALIAATPGPAFPAAALARPPGGGGAAGPVPALATPGAASALGQARASLTIGTAGQVVPIRVVRTGAMAAAISAESDGALIVLPQWAVSGPARSPNLLLVTGAGLDGQRLTAVANRVVPGATVTLRARALAALASAPLPHGTYVLYAVGAVVAGGYGIVVLLMILLLGADSRERTLARLAAMGLSARQARWLVLVEALPELVVATACGTGCAWALAVLVGPDLSLSLFTGSAAAVQIRAEPAALAAAAAVLLGVGVATLLCQVVIAGRRGVARTLRIGG
jgi:putative ABC transport system permease protein